LWLVPPVLHQDGERSHSPLLPQVEFNRRRDIPPLAPEMRYHGRRDASVALKACGSP